jgi:hypothetical protein
MKKTVQIVTIPLDKKNWKPNTLCKYIKKDCIYKPYGKFEIDRIGHKLPNYAINTLEYWQTLQLLVLSDDEIQAGDVKHSRNGEPYKKVIASYPNILGTLKLSTKMIQKWIDNNAPEETNVEIIKDCQGWGGRGCQSLCSCPLKYKVEEFPYSGDAYPKDNLILEFDKK